MTSARLRKRIRTANKQLQRTGYRPPLSRDVRLKKMFKKLLNIPEKTTHRKLKDICNQYDAAVFAKVRLADVLPVENSGITDSEFRFALQSHFDFVIADLDTMPLFAVEFNGKHHEQKIQKERDRKKISLCKRFEFPLLKITSKFLSDTYRSMDILTWFIEVWFLKEEFYKQQEAGNIPYDEPFDPMNIMYDPTKQEHFPFWLSLPILVEIQKLHEIGKCLDPGPSHIVGMDKEGNYHVIGWIIIDKNSGVLSKMSMISQNFYIPISELLGELIAYEVHTKLMQAIKGEIVLTSVDTLSKEIKVFNTNYQSRGSITFGGQPN
ncbi:MAG: hypothetical protein STSR0004_22490 [Peptococcaceae bacterium]